MIKKIILKGMTPLIKKLERKGLNILVKEVVDFDTIQNRIVQSTVDFENANYSGKGKHFISSEIGLIHGITEGAASTIDKVIPGKIADDWISDSIRIPSTIAVGGIALLPRVAKFSENWSSKHIKGSLPQKKAKAVLPKDNKRLKKADIIKQGYQETISKSGDKVNYPNKDTHVNPETKVNPTGDILKDRWKQNYETTK